MKVGRLLLQIEGRHSDFRRTPLQYQCLNTATSELSKTPLRVNPKML
jgi:hypothetical protein